jgi:hypothetical protein
MSDARVTVTGRVTPIPEAEKKEARDLYIAKNPTSFWIDFGDFTFFRMESIITSRLIGGFARAGQVNTLFPAHTHHMTSTPWASND